MDTWGWEGRKQEPCSDLLRKLLQQRQVGGSSLEGKGTGVTAQGVTVSAVKLDDLSWTPQWWKERTGSYMCTPSHRHPHTFTYKINK